MVLVALIVFLTQGSQLQVTATVLSEHCHKQFDVATDASETRCDAAVRYTTVTGRIDRTTINDAFRDEFNHPQGKPATIRLRYDRDYPADPFKQSNYMPAWTFVTLLGLGALAGTFGTVWLARAVRIAENSMLRQLRGPEAAAGS